MTRSGVLLSFFVLSLPITVRMGSTPGDSVDSERHRFGHLQPGTSFSVAGGGGTFGLVDRGCEGGAIRWTSVRYRDVAVKVEHRFESPVTLGVRGGLLHERRHPVDPTSPGVLPPSTVDHRWVVPYVRFDARSIGVGAGPFLADGQFERSEGPSFDPTLSADLRLGPADRVSLRIGWMEGFPLVSNGGYFTVGTQVSAWRDFESYFGLSTGGPDDGGGLIVRASWWFADEAAMHVSGRIGRAEPVTEYGLTLGLTLRTPPRVAPTAGDP